MSSKRSAKRRPKRAGDAARGSEPAAQPRPQAQPPQTAAQRRRPRWLVPVALAGAAALAIGLFIALRDAPDEPPPMRAAAATAPAPASPPTPPSPSTAKPANRFIGSAQCADCHEKEHARWQKSWHARALAPAAGRAVVGDFQNAHFAGASSEAWMKRAGERYVMRARDAAGAFADFPVDWVIGGKRMQDNVTVLPDGRWQVLPVYFHVTGKAWVDYTETKQGPLAPEHPFYWTNVRRMANHECLDCHVTALRVGYDEPSRKWTTSFVDGSVACESCHGPGGRHAETSAPADIVQPVRAGAVGLAACARCHGPRKPLFPMLDADHAFELGQPYDEFYDPIVIVQGGGMSPEFFVDGKPRTSSFEYQAMLQAACFRKGGATCLTCHTAPHDAAQGHAELRAADPDASCRKCHADVAAAGRAHTHHAAPAAQRCVACHMPPVVSGVLDHFADHAIDVPVPQNTASHGVPNACGVCHPKESPGALATSLAAWWPEAAVRQARRIRLANAFDPAAAKQSVRPLLETITDASEAPTVRGAAAIVLGLRFGPQATRALVPFLDSPDLVLRVKACEALAAARATGAADAIAAHLDDRALRVRLACALTLFDLKDSRGEPALRRLATDTATSHLMVPHFELGRALARRRDFPAARAELTHVARLTPYFTDGLVELGQVAAATGDLAEARARVEQALQLEPHHARARAFRDQLGTPAP